MTELTKLNYMKDTALSFYFLANSVWHLLARVSE